MTRLYCRLKLMIACQLAAFFEPAFVLCGAQLEPAAGMLASPPGGRLDIRQSPHESSGSANILLLPPITGASDIAFVGSSASSDQFHRGGKRLLANQAAYSPEAPPLLTPSFQDFRRVLCRQARQALTGQAWHRPVAARDGAGTAAANAAAAPVAALHDQRAPCTARKPIKLQTVGRQACLTCAFKSSDRQVLPSSTGRYSSKQLLGGLFGSAPFSRNRRLPASR